MKTLKSNLKLNGGGLMFAAPVEVELKPSNEKGIRFHIQEGTIEAKLENVVSTDHCVILADVERGAKHKVALVEHFMAACAICEIEALDVYINSQGFEMPIFDGSAKVWVEEFQKTGFAGEVEPQVFLTKFAVFKNQNTSIFVAPSDRTSITYAVNFRHPELKNRWASLNLDENLSEIIGARTFGYLSDLEKFQAQGYSKGVTIENTVGLKDDGSYTTELRCEYEPIKHKILDIIGDFYLTGYNPLRMNANILAKEAGHKNHIELAYQIRKILSQQGEQQ